MAKRFLKIVTVTGADDSIDVKFLAELSVKYPFVEWGILLSNSKTGNAPRYPSRAWLKNLENEVWSVDNRISLSAHLCGRYVRDVFEGNWRHEEEWGIGFKSFDRIQLNFSRSAGPAYKDVFVGGVAKKMQSSNMSLILGCPVTRWELLRQLQEEQVNAFPLFDVSGGRGILSGHWPVAQGFCGYAGGLNPDNVAEQIEKIFESVGENLAWIDVESGVRTEEKFDLKKVDAFLKVASHYVIEE